MHARRIMIRQWTCHDAYVCDSTGPLGVLSLLPDLKSTELIMFFLQISSLHYMSSLFVGHVFERPSFRAWR